MAKASPFSFHCIVCFEEFHHDDRYPVVLPCGHTYVCHECANKLDRCTECRTSLSMMLPGPSPGVERVAGQGTQRQIGWSNARSGGRVHTSPVRGTGGISPSPPVNRRLPLPKNIVLLSLMEATTIAVNDLPASPFPSPIKQSVSSDEFDIEDEKIRVGTSMAIGICGTYVVRAKNNVQIFPSRPSTLNCAYSRTDSDFPEEEDVDTLVRFFHMDSQLEIKSGPPAPVELKRGDRVQIVTFEEGWVKLARGYGFIRADAGQIVKVGGSVDRACKLEALLRSLAMRRRTFQKELLELDSQFITLMRDLQNSLTQDEDLTVIGADTFKLVDKDDVPTQIAKEERINIATTRAEPDELFKPNSLVRQATPPMLQQGGLACFSVPDVCGAFGGLGERRQEHHLTIPRRQALDDNLIPIACYSYGDENSIIEQVRTALSFGDDHSSICQSSADRPTPFCPSPRSLSAGARAWRERNGREPSVGVDFRTGFSGHTALSSSHGHVHDELPRQQASRKMSSHSGLNVRYPSRSTRKNMEPFASSATSTIGVRRGTHAKDTNY